MPVRQIPWMVIALLAVLLHATPAAAHAVLESAAPADRSVLATAPRQFSLQFDEAVAVTDLRLLDQTGRSVQLRVKSADRVVSGTIEENLDPGAYTLSYRVISGDGHPVAGAVQFQIGPGPEHWRAAEGGLAAWQWASLLARWALYLGAFLTWGLAWRRPQQGRRRSAMMLCTSLCAVGAILGIGFQGLGMAGASFDALANPRVWQLAIGSPEAAIVSWILGGLLLCWLAIRPVSGRLRDGFLAAGGLAFVVALATSGHVAAIGWTASLVLALHVSGALIWIGSVASLLRQPRIARQQSPSPSSLPGLWRRQAVIWSMILAGLGLACWQVAKPAMLWQTAYGQVLALKIAAVAGVFGFAAINRWGGFAPAIRGKLAIGQAFILVAVLGLTAALGQLTPPRHLLLLQGQDPASPIASDPAPLLEEMVHDRDAMAQIKMKRQASDSYELLVQFSDLDGRPLQPLPVTVRFQSETAGLGPLSRELSAAGQKGAYRLPDIHLPPGRWQIEIKADLSDFDRRIFAAELTIAR